MKLSIKKVFGFLTLIFVSTLATAETSKVKTIPYLDLNKYLGKWYEVASIPQSFQKKCVKNTEAIYSLIGEDKIEVNNSCEMANGERNVALGRAKIKDKKSQAKLKVTFVKLIGWIYPFGGNYWVLHVDEFYNFAVVGDPSAKYAWILSRNPYISHDDLMIARNVLKTNGYDTCAVLTSVQDGGFSDRTPLCKL